MPSRSSLAAATEPDVVDTAPQPSLSFAPLDRPTEQARTADSPAARPRDRAQRQRPRVKRPRIVVEGDAPINQAGDRSLPGGLLGAMPEFPVQLSKIQPPPLRDETLARDRLLDWLSMKIHRRVVLLTAEAGYGKTTLLADFTRRTRMRVLWYRLDQGDRDWAGFVAHVLAAFRLHAPEFGGATAAILAGGASGPPALDDVLESLLLELAALPPEPMAFVFDDFHLVDDAPEIRSILRELLARSPDRTTYVFASRREPPIRLARLRALGEVSELRTDDLRFNSDETERLFHDTYSMPLESSVLGELSRRTEGWPASLQLVRAALHDRDPRQVRAFIASLSGAEGHLYEYLAEEVVGELSTELQQFLMRTSVLETVDLVLGPVAGQVDVETTKRLIDEAERQGLLGRGGSRQKHVVRAHPLVRDFLEARFARAVSSDGVRAAHVAVAGAAEAHNWHLSARHYIAAGLDEEAARVLKQAIERISAAGAYALADDLARAISPAGLTGSTGLLLKSRIALARSSLDEALRLAEEAWKEDPTSTAVLVNLMTARHRTGDVRGALAASALLETRDDPQAEAMFVAFQLMMDASVGGSVPEAANALARFAAQVRQGDGGQYAGVSLLNRSSMLLAMGDIEAALEVAAAAIDQLSDSPPGAEFRSAQLAHATALAFRGDISGFRGEAAVAAQMATPDEGLEIAFEVGQVEALLGDPRRAVPLIDAIRPRIGKNQDLGHLVLLSCALTYLRLGELSAAAEAVAQIEPNIRRSAVAFEARRRLLEGRVKMNDDSAAALAAITSGTLLAAEQGARLWAAYGEVLGALADTQGDPSRVLEQAVGRFPIVLAMLADEVVDRLRDLTTDAKEQVVATAATIPERWLPAVRTAVQSSDPLTRESASLVLVRIGEPEDAKLLRDVGRGRRDRGLVLSATELARRLAPRVFIFDLGRVQIQIGNRLVEGSSLRRKVLALLCLLLTKSGFAATREEVVDSLWPDSDPSSALNSLNQTVYFLRRAFEASYSEDGSPGYVGQDGETVWLDRELVDCASRQCLSILRDVSDNGMPEAAISLVGLYRGRFALDFAYDDWSSTFRDSLHASFLRLVEQSLHSDIRAGHTSRGIFVAERASEVEPESEELQIALIQLYGLAGAHAAAAEQYGLYSRSSREIGVEPRPLSDLGG